MNVSLLDIQPSSKKIAKNSRFSNTQPSPELLQNLEKDDFQDTFLLDETLPEDLSEDGFILTLENEDGAGLLEETAVPATSPLPHYEDEIQSNDFLSMYLQENQQHMLLSAEEEVKLAQEIEAGREAHLKLDQEHLAETERLTLLHLKEAGENARNQLVQANTRLVISIAKRYRGQGLDFLDLIQEGNIGLLIAVDKYDYRMGNRFSTYATWWIRQGVTRALTNFGRAIRIPAHLNTSIRHIYRVTQQFEQSHDRPPTTDELSELVNLPVDRVRWLQQVTLPLLHLEQPSGDDMEAELGDFVEDTETPKPLEAVAQKMFSERIGDILGQLTPREAAVLRLRYGLQGYQAHTLKEVGELFGLSRERIRQLEIAALRKLRWHHHGHASLLN